MKIRVSSLDTHKLIKEITYEEQLDYSKSLGLPF